MNGVQQVRGLHGRCKQLKQPNCSSYVGSGSGGPCLPRRSSLAIQQVLPKLSVETHDPAPLGKGRLHLLPQRHAQGLRLIGGVCPRGGGGRGRPSASATTTFEPSSQSTIKRSEAMPLFMPAILP